MHLRDNLDGLGYAMGPRGLFGLGNDSSVFDVAAVGNSNSALPLRKSTTVDAYTRAAVFQFQRDRTLPANGDIGEDLYNRVDSMVKDLQNNLKIVLLAGDGVDRQVLGELDNSSAVPADKKFRISGYYGNQTFRFVKEYQRLRKLPITGIATIAVARQISDEARRLTNPNPTPTKTPATTDAAPRLAKLSQIKQRYQRGEILSDDFVREMMQEIP
ncbi:MAG: peptidoglycan-binding protein [Alkalinema sp. FL-bin-369]|nr:peptidoglycan-binding protein [Leptolyngbyaceae cyanobacterium LF-bin-369]